MATSVFLESDEGKRGVDQRPRLTGPSRYLGRQPIVDARGGLFGYELRLRSEKAARADEDPERATREAIDHWLLLIPEPQEGNAFVRCTRLALIDRLLTLLPAGATVLILPTAADAGHELVEACRGLRRQGYRLAVESTALLEAPTPLVDMAEFVHIDFPETDFEKRREIYRRADGNRPRFVAENIDTEVQMRIALAEGCSLFQGNFICQPVLFLSRPVPRNATVYLNLLSVLHRVPADLRKVEKLISGDPSLCYRVLRLANSALQGHPGAISSIREALLLVGDEAVRRLVVVAMAGTLAAHRSPALLGMALARARFCELVAPELREEQGRYYLLGILSVLDALLETPLDRILRSLPVTPEMKSALAGDDSTAGRTLALVRSLEACEWRGCEEMQNVLGLAEGFVSSVYVEAIRWAAGMMGSEARG
jgi:c-di-GMP-related signal transduction protein